MAGLELAYKLLWKIGGQNVLPRKVEWFLSIFSFCDQKSHNLCVIWMQHLQKLSDANQMMFKIPPVFFLSFSTPNLMPNFSIVLGKVLRHLCNVLLSILSVIKQNIAECLKTFPNTIEKFGIRVGFFLSVGSEPFC